MEEIDEDILVDILSRLPARPLGQLKSTNKRWYRLISDPYFVKLHLERSKKDTTGARQKVLKVSNRFCWKQQGIDTEFVGFKLFESGGQEMAIPYHRDPITWPFQPLKSVKIGGSCDGLICLVIHSGHRPTIRLWNPTTSEYRELPNVCHRREPNPVHEYWHSSIFGLGYDSGADDYKVISDVSVFRRHDNALQETLVDVFSLRTSTWKRIHDRPKGCHLSPRGSFYLNGAVH
ncbi:hypothetical protein CRG98_011390 [Punica granatum]|uniref:F-box domain-containing protein n=1 Tax=Punica granatum TaxID=22663 RepID=A0A2I0KI91_PUNGR|nr:hypothetical protein CRG98_011390 [Punica granatum]